jgi:hypothetical protein
VVWFTCWRVPWFAQMYYSRKSRSSLQMPARWMQVVARNTQTCQDHGHDLLVRPGPRTRNVRRPTTVRGRPPSKTQFRSVFRNGNQLLQVHSG